MTSSRCPATGVDVTTGDGLAPVDLHRPRPMARVRSGDRVDIGIDRFTSGYNAAKIAQEQAALAGPIPVRILRAAQFHEFVSQLVDWGRQGDVSYVPKMRTQLIAARTVAAALADLAADPESAPGPILEIAGPREESMVEAAKLLAARDGNGLRIEGVAWDERYEAGAALPGPDATLAGPTFEEWLGA